MGRHPFSRMERASVRGLGPASTMELLAECNIHPPDFPRRSPKPRCRARFLAQLGNVAFGGCLGSRVDRQDSNRRLCSIGQGHVNEHHLDDRSRRRRRRREDTREVGIL